MTRDEILDQAREAVAMVARSFAARADKLQAIAERQAVVDPYIMRQIADLEREYHETLAPIVKQYADILGMLPPQPVVATKAEWDEITGNKPRTS